jgi:hypothetical protein
VLTVVSIAVMVAGVGRAAVVTVEVPGGRAFDPAGAEPGAAGGQQRGQDGSADRAGQVSRAVRADPGGGELVFGGFHRGGEAGPVRVGARAGLDGGDHGYAQQLVEGERGPGFLFQAGPVTRAQHMAIEQDVPQRECGRP